MCAHCGVVAAPSREPSLPAIHGALERQPDDEEERSNEPEFAQSQQYEPTLSPRDVHLVRLEDLRRQQNEELLVRNLAIYVLTISSATSDDR